MKQFLTSAVVAGLLAFAASAHAFGDTPGLNGGDSTSATSTSPGVSSFASDGRITPYERNQAASTGGNEGDTSMDVRLIDELLALFGMEDSEG